MQRLLRKLLAIGMLTKQEVFRPMVTGTAGQRLTAERFEMPECACLRRQAAGSHARVCPEHG
jgi:hypothetical protein